jgi:predicted RNase H-like HicB family nuclease
MNDRDKAIQEVCKEERLPVNQKFTFYLDDEGDYIIQGMADKKYLVTHGDTPDEAVKEMGELLVLDSKRLREVDKSEGSLPAGFVVPELQSAPAKTPEPTK